MADKKGITPKKEQPEKYIDALQEYVNTLQDFIRGLQTGTLPPGTRPPLPPKVPK